MVGVVEPAMLHQHDLVLARSHHVGTEDAQAAIRDPGLHGFAFGLHHEHIPVQAPQALDLHPARLLGILSFPESATGGLQRVKRKKLHELCRGVHLGFYPRPGRGLRLTDQRRGADSSFPEPGAVCGQAGFL